MNFLGRGNQYNNLLGRLTDVSLPMECCPHAALEEAATTGQRLHAEGQTPASNSLVLAVAIPMLGAHASQSSQKRQGQFQIKGRSTT